MQNKESPYYHILAEVFKLDQYIKVVDSHRHFIQKSFLRFSEKLPLLSQNVELVKNHDKSKYQFDQLIGYCARFMWNMSEEPLWHQALSHHYQNNSHHPEYYNDGRMNKIDLQESVVDMIACHWERTLHGQESLSDKQLLDFDRKHLLRFHAQDKIEVEKILQRLMNEA